MGLTLTKSLLNQAGVIPYRFRGGELEFLMVTSRGTGRWLFPKGNIDAGDSARKTAIREAFEEAGLVGEVARRPIGSYTAFKTREEKGTLPAVVEMYPMEAVTCRKSWPERKERERRWVPAEQATDEVAEEGLKILLIQLRARLSA